MREIKFKYVWQHKKDKDFQPKIFTIDQIEKHSLIHHESIRDYFIEDGYEFFDRFQHTGRKDKNDVEIYEGDILKNEHGDKAIIDYQEFTASFMPRSYYGGGTRWFHQKNEVIGNIYENPELLEAKS